MDDVNEKYLLARGEFQLRRTAFTEATGVKLPEHLHTAFAMCALANSHLLVEASTETTPPAGIGYALAATIPMLAHLTCSLLVCTSTTSPEDLFRQLFRPFIAGANTTRAGHALSPRASGALQSPICRQRSVEMTEHKLDKPAVPPASVRTIPKQQTRMWSASNVSGGIAEVFVVENIDCAPNETQEALLDVITHRRLQLGGFLHNTPELFMVVGVVGRSLSKFSGLLCDRFLVSICLATVPNLTSLHNHEANEEYPSVFTKWELVELRKGVKRVYLSEDVMQYIRTIIVAIRNHPDVVDGPSPWGSKAAMKAVKVAAALIGQDFVTPSHVQAVLAEVLRHRVRTQDVLSSLALAQCISPATLKKDRLRGPVLWLLKAKVTKQTIDAGPLVMDIIRALDLLATVPLESQGSSEDAVKQRRQEKMKACRVVCDQICVPVLRTTAEFPRYLSASISALLRILGDEDMAVWTVAEECLNKVINNLVPASPVFAERILVDLYKGVKSRVVIPRSASGTFSADEDDDHLETDATDSKTSVSPKKPALSENDKKPKTITTAPGDGNRSRVTRAALLKFSELCHHLHPSKCRKFMLSMLAPIAGIIEHGDELLQEALSQAMDKLCATLVYYLREREVNRLIELFTKNLSHPTASVRRAAASSIITLCRRFPKTPFDYAVFLLRRQNQDSGDDVSTAQHLGTLHCFLQLVRLSDEMGQSAVDPHNPILQYVPFLADYILSNLHHADHNVVVLALELLQQLLGSYGHYRKVWGDGPAVQRFLEALYAMLGSPLRVSVKAVALACMAQAAKHYALAFAGTFFGPTGSQWPALLALLGDNDPLLRGNAALLLGYYLCGGLTVVNSCPFRCGCGAEAAAEVDSEHAVLFGQQPVVPLVRQLVRTLVADPSSIAQKQACAALAECIPPLARSRHAHLVAEVVSAVLGMHQEASYWLVKAELAGLLAKVEWGVLEYALAGLGQPSLWAGPSHLASLQPAVLSYVVGLLADSDGRVRHAAGKALADMVVTLHPFGELEGREGRLRGPLAAVFSEGQIDRLDEAAVSRAVVANLPRVLHAILQAMADGGEPLLRGAYHALVLVVDRFSLPAGLVDDDDGGTRFALATPHVDSLPNAAGPYLADVVPIALERYRSSSSLLADLELHLDLLRLVGRLARKAAPFLAPYWPQCLQHVARVVALLSDIEENRPPPDPTSPLTPTAASPPASSSTPPSSSSPTTPAPFPDNDQVYVELYHRLQSTRRVGHTTLDDNKFDEVRKEGFASLAALVRAGGSAVQPHAEGLLAQCAKHFERDPQAVLPCVQELFLAVFRKPDLPAGKLPPDPPATDQPLPTAYISWMRAAAGASAPTGRVVVPAGVLLHPYSLHEPDVVSAGSPAFPPTNRQLIRVFEPLVVGAMREYRVTHDQQLQQAILFMLRSFVSFGIDFARLDKDNTFLEFVIQQILGKKAYLPNPPQLLPYIFDFLGVLSIGRRHLPDVLTKDKLLEVVSCVFSAPYWGETGVLLPSLRPLVRDLFGTGASGKLKKEHVEFVLELRKDLLSLILTKAHFSAALDLLLVVAHGKPHYRPEEWLAYCSLIADVLLPMVLEARLHVTRPVDMLRLFALFDVLAGSPSSSSIVGPMVGSLLRFAFSMTDSPEPPPSTASVSDAGRERIQRQLAGRERELAEENHLQSAGLAWLPSVLLALRVALAAPHSAVVLAIDGYRGLSATPPGPPVATAAMEECYGAGSSSEEVAVVALFNILHRVSSSLAANHATAVSSPLLSRAVTWLLRLSTDWLCHISSDAFSSPAPMASSPFPLLEAARQLARQPAFSSLLLHTTANILAWGLAAPALQLFTLLRALRTPCTVVELWTAAARVDVSLPLCMQHALLRDVALRAFADALCAWDPEFCGYPAEDQTVTVWVKCLVNHVGSPWAETALSALLASPVGASALAAIESILSTATLSLTTVHGLLRAVTASQRSDPTVLPVLVNYFLRDSCYSVFKATLEAIERVLTQGLAVSTPPPTACVEMVVQLRPKFLLSIRERLRGRRWAHDPPIASLLASIQAMFKRVDAGQTSDDEGLVSPHVEPLPAPSWLVARCHKDAAAPLSSLAAFAALVPEGSTYPSTIEAHLTPLVATATLHDSLLPQLVTLPGLSPGFVAAIARYFQATLAGIVQAGAASEPPRAGYLVGLRRFIEQHHEQAEALVPPSELLAVCTVLLDLCLRRLLAGSMAEQSLCQVLKLARAAICHAPAAGLVDQAQLVLPPSPVWNQLLHAVWRVTSVLLPHSLAAVEPAAPLPPTALRSLVLVSLEKYERLASTHFRHPLVSRRGVVLLRGLLCAIADKSKQALLYPRMAAHGVLELPAVSPLAEAAKDGEGRLHGPIPPPHEDEAVTLLRQLAALHALLGCRGKDEFVCSWQLLTSLVQQHPAMHKEKAAAPLEPPEDLPESHLVHAVRCVTALLSQFLPAATPLHRPRLPHSSKAAADQRDAVPFLLTVQGQRVHRLQQHIQRALAHVIAPTSPPHGAAPYAGSPLPLFSGSARHVPCSVPVGQLAQRRGTQDGLRPWDGVDVVALIEALLVPFEALLTPPTSSVLPASTVPHDQLGPHRHSWLRLEVIRSLVYLSDLFYYQHFVWMLTHFSKLYSSTDDSLARHWLLLGWFKAYAVVNFHVTTTSPATPTSVLLALASVSSPSSASSSPSSSSASTPSSSVTGQPQKELSKLLRHWVESYCAGSMELPSQTCMHYSLLYLLEARVGKQLLQPLVPMLMKHMAGTLASGPAQPIRLLVAQLALCFQLIEHFPKETEEVDFARQVVASGIALAGSRDTCPDIVRSVCSGFDRLLITGSVLSAALQEQLLSFGMQKLLSSQASDFLLALGLLVSSLYTRQGSRISEPVEGTAYADNVERVKILFSRIREGGLAIEAEAVSRALPRLLVDFFAADQIISLVLGEFVRVKLGSFPELLAYVLKGVFAALCAEQRSHKDTIASWLLMCLNNFTHIRPTELSLWALGCLFLSTAAWPKCALFSQLETIVEADHELIAWAAAQYYCTLDEESRKLFLDTLEERPERQFQWLALVCRGAQSTATQIKQ